MPKQTTKPKTVFVGLSGGVDSSVAAHLLKKQGYNVVGVYMRTWQPDFIECTWRDEKRDAMRVAAHLDIPFVFMDVSHEYEQMVAAKMISEYKKGRTPNPDVLCNRDIKFGVFLKHALRHGADFIATGHYAQVHEEKIKHTLSRGKDPAKDQAYFLWMLSEDELSRTLFPLGNMKKTEVRKLAAKIGLPTAEKKDSQGICFIGNINMKDFLLNYIEPQKGNVLDEKGEVIGDHEGAAFYTIGERHGFTILNHTPNDLPCYIVGKDAAKNTITVSHSNPFELEKKISAVNNTFFLTDTNFRQFIDPKKIYTVESRYHGEKGTAMIRQMAGNTAEVILVSSPGPVVSGQSFVVYDKNVCVGGGVIS
ncbi:MAG: tRNA 2-thiouridine(34) synthase MnmA [Candidatus Pacebacteria bacterium]|nr:tRNA 2-thiouridine(34) synthase MnmA [Candidatus Paceibacterota bacterium]